MPGTLYKVLLVALPLVSSTATTTLHLLKDKHGDRTSRRAIQPIWASRGVTGPLVPSPAR